MLRDEEIINYPNITQNFCFSLGAIKSCIVTLRNDLRAPKLRQKDKLDWMIYCFIILRSIINHQKFIDRLFFTLD